MRYRSAVSLILQIGLLLGGCLTAAAQSSPPDKKSDSQDEKGVTSTVEFDGSVNSLGDVFSLTPQVGYDFNRHFGVTFGAPIYMVRGSSTTGSNNANGLGDPFVGLLLRFPGKTVNYNSVVTGGIPLGNTDLGLSTGRFTIDWTNRFDHSFSRLTPFAALGIGNTIRDSRFFRRPFTTLGFNFHFEGGADVDVWKFVSVGGSFYDIEPAGTQRVFSKLVPAGHMGHNGGHGVFGVNHETVGGSDLTRDRGVSAWIDATPNRVLGLELGYSRSVDFDLDTFFFGVNLNVARLLRKSGPSQ